MLSGDRPEHRARRSEIKGEIYAPFNWAQQVNDYYYQTTCQLIKSHSDELGTNRYQLDIVKQ
jgi:hypothetical protein